MTLLGIYKVLVVSLTERAVFKSESVLMIMSHTVTLMSMGKNYFYFLL